MRRVVVWRSKNDWESWMPSTRQSRVDSAQRRVLFGSRGRRRPGFRYFGASLPSSASSQVRSPTRLVYCELMQCIYCRNIHYTTLSQFPHRPAWSKRLLNRKFAVKAKIDLLEGRVARASNTVTGKHRQSIGMVSGGYLGTSTTKDDL